MMEGSETSSATGLFSETLSDLINTQETAQAGADTSQISSVDVDLGALVIQLDSEASNHVTTLLGSAIADSFSSSELYLEFTTTETMRLTVDITVSSSLVVFFDPPASSVETSHIGSALLCAGGGGCLIDLLVEDVTDDAQAVSQRVADSADIPPGQYVLQLLAVSQSISEGVGSAAGAGFFSGELRLDPLPEPDRLLSGLTVLVVMSLRRRSRGRPWRRTPAPNA